MRRVRRFKLPEPARAFLATRTALVLAASDRVGEAARLWKQRGAPLRVIRATLEQMAGGLARCMYCEADEGTDIEHFRPRALYPERAFQWQNYLLACSHCNSNAKRDQFPREQTTRRPLLIKPTRDDPSDHLEFLPIDGTYRGRTPMGLASIAVFALNRAILAHGRRNAWTDLEALLTAYGEARAVGNDARCLRIHQALREHPFPRVFDEMERVATLPPEDAVLLVDSRALAVVLRDGPALRRPR